MAVRIVPGALQQYIELIVRPGHSPRLRFMLNGDGMPIDIQATIIKSNITRKWAVRTVKSGQVGNGFHWCWLVNGHHLDTVTKSLLVNGSEYASANTPKTIDGHPNWLI